MKLLVLVDTKQYVFNEIYQQHLHPLLLKEHQCAYAELSDIQSGASVPRGTFDAVLCTMRFRNVVRNVDAVQRFLNDAPVTILDIDPWVAYDDTSPLKGSYEVVAPKLNVKNFINGSTSWAEFLQHRGYSAYAVQIGVVPSMCAGKRWEDRQYDVEFRGAHRDYRERNFNRLAKMGIRNVWKKDFIKSYPAFLEHVSNLRIWLQYEGEPVMVDGIPHEYNGLWPKALETLCRGCFLVRNRQSEAKFYEIESFPTAFLFDRLEEIPEKIELIKSMNPDERNDRIETTMQMLRTNRYYERWVERMSSEL